MFYRVKEVENCGAEGRIGGPGDNVRCCIASMMRLSLPVRHSYDMLVKHCFVAPEEEGKRQQY